MSYPSSQVKGPQTSLSSLAQVGLSPLGRGGWGGQKLDWGTQVPNAADQVPAVEQVMEVVPLGTYPEAQVYVHDPPTEVVHEPRSPFPGGVGRVQKLGSMVQVSGVPE